MHPINFAQTTPSHPATIIAETGQMMTYGELDDLSRRLAGALRALGIAPGDHLAMLVSNDLMFHPICWAAWTAGIYFTPMSTRLQPDELAYIIGDSGAKAVIASPEFEAILTKLRPTLPGTPHWFVTTDGTGDLPSIATLVEGRTPLVIAPDAIVGTDMIYSSGTTGRPKGIVPRGGRRRDEPLPLALLWQKQFQMNAATRYLSPAPLYHSAPLRFSMTVQRAGGTVVLMKRFDAEAALEAIERYGITHSQWVPTMLHRLSRLPDAVKVRYDISSLRVAIHASAPCPPDLKRQIIEWWGPILHEYYAGSESIGFTAIDSLEWLQHPGSVGRAKLGELHIVGEDGSELPAGEVGQIYFGNGPQFAYHNDPEKTAAAYHERGWTTLGDMGRVDPDGYLYLSDRRDFMIITGGVNVYPKEIEDVLVMHPDVDDVAVFGIPNEDFGEEVKAVVQPTAWPIDEDSLREELNIYCRAHLSPIKAPRSFDFTRSLPRQENGKLYKKALRDAMVSEIDIARGSGSLRSD